MHPIVETIFKWGVRNAPKILTTIGICGVAGTAVMAVKATPEAMQRIEDLKFADPEDKVENTVKKIKAVAPVYAPAVAMGGVTIASILGSQHILSTRQAAAAISASIAETALKEYQDAAIKTIGAKKHKMVMDEVARKRLPQIVDNVDEKDIYGSGATLFADCQTGQMFRSDIETVRKAEAEVARRMSSQMIVSLNDFYELMGLRDVKLGDTNGWIVDRGDQFEIYFTYEPHPRTEEPITVINYDVSYLGRY